MVSRMQGQKSPDQPPAVSEAPSAELADSATALFCSTYMLHAAASLGVLDTATKRISRVEL
jgi:hypothetical protein